jgi:hypothetical protein
MVKVKFAGPGIPAAVKHSWTFVCLLTAAALARRGAKSTQASLGRNMMMKYQVFLGREERNSRMTTEGRPDELSYDIRVQI